MDKEKHNRDRLVDLAAKLCEAERQLHSHVESIKAAIKASLLEDEKTIAEGENFIAVLSFVDKTILLTEKVKTFLGKKLNEFQETRTEKHLTFKPKI